MVEDQQAQSAQLSQRIEKDVRMLIGDLQMQILVLRGMLELSQGASPKTSQPEVRTNGATPPQHEATP